MVFKDKKTCKQKPAGIDAADQNRTDDTRIFSPLLYRLSYSGNHVDIYIFNRKKCQLAFIKNKTNVKCFYLKNYMLNAWAIIAVSSLENIVYCIYYLKLLSISGGYFV